MLPKTLRLKDKKTFNRIYKNGQRNRTRNLGLVWLSNGLENSRFGIVISNKVEAKASKRNRIKRQIRAMVYQNLESLPKGFDFIITVIRSVSDAEYKKIEEEIKELFQKINQ